MKNNQQTLDSAKSHEQERITPLRSLIARYFLPPLQKGF